MLELAKFIVNSMTAFDRENFQPGLQSSSNDDIYSYALENNFFREKMTWAVSNYWLPLARLPFEATHSVEALIQCVMHFLDKHSQETINATFQPLLKAALLGVGLLTKTRMLMSTT